MEYIEKRLRHYYYDMDNDILFCKEYKIDLDAEEIKVPSVQAISFVVDVYEEIKYGLLPSYCDDILLISPDGLWVINFYYPNNYCLSCITQVDEKGYISLINKSPLKHNVKYYALAGLFYSLILCTMFYLLNKIIPMS